jgi:uncharacterized membrane protein
MSVLRKILFTFGFFFLFSGAVLKILHWEFGFIDGTALIVIGYFLLFTGIVLYIWRKPEK